MATEKKTDVARYDRQIRLWGEDGQRNLQQANLCLLNATATGTETLKNLVLPGIGAYTIVDGTKVSEADLGNNFFVTEEDVGKSKAAVTCQLLQELNFSDNPNIFAPTGHFVEKDPVAVIEKEIQFFKSFSHVIASSLPEDALLKLAAFCYENNIPLFVEKTQGFLGYLRVVTPEHTVVQSKPDNPADDLRLVDPWDELANYAATFDLDKLQGGEHAHVPFIVILLNVLRKWKAEHGGKIPSNSEEKAAFKKTVVNMAHGPTEENFPEAHKSAHKAFSPYRIPSQVQEILNDPKAKSLNANSTPFWILAHAVSEFVANEGKGTLPLMGTIPDMTASTQGYVQLQGIYQDKAAKDVAAVTARVKDSLAKLGKPENFITPEQIKEFCKNSLFLSSIRYRPLADEYNPKTAKSALIAQNLQDKNSHISWYVALRAGDRFFSKHNRYAGSSDDKASIESDVRTLKSYADAILTELNVSPSAFEEKYLQELVRFGGSELHTIAALLGGVVSQEVIKIITHQYTALNNTFIFNGLDSTSGAFEL